eukprot:3843292-Rhodomonas_salina.2
MSGTNLPNAVMRCAVVIHVSTTRIAYGATTRLRPCYAMPGTHKAYAATSPPTRSSKFSETAKNAPRAF